MSGDARVQRLAVAFREIAATRMAGVALCNPRLQVAAVGFRTAPATAAGSDVGGGAMLGVLVTPWFMNLVWLTGAGEAPLAVGATRVRTVGAVALPFIGAHEAAVGAYEACSLYSPMEAFADQAAAIATARAVMDELGRPAPLAAPQQPSRRAFLTGTRPAAA